MSEKMPNFDYDADEVINDFKEKFKWPGSGEVQAVVKPTKVPLKLLLSAIITAVISAGVYYMMLPAFNIHDTQMYIFIIVVIAVFMAVFSLLCKANKKIEHREYVKKKSVVPLIIVGVILVVMLIGYLVGATIFRAADYSELMTVSNSDFDTDFADISYDEVPRIDASRAKTLADQQLGSLSEYKSQYVVSDTTTQINYKGVPCRVAVLQYADVFKWINNTKDGLPAYILIDVVSQKVTVVNCVEQFGSGIKYSPAEYFNEKLYRHIRFQYPTKLLDTPNFEIDDTGHPYWVTAALDKKIGLFGGTDVEGAIITDALTGESKYYSIEDVRNNSELNWIDVVYSDQLLIEQYNYYGKLKKGFWNSIIFQNDVNVASSGNGYIAMDDDVWVYTGVTSSKADTSNFGFILCNQRTKEVRYYQNGGAIESSAMESAQDAVQNFGYYATFPILLDIDGQPSYFMSLYGDSNTVKGYALVSLEDKTVVGTGLIDTNSDAQALNAAVENYIVAMKDKGMISEDVDVEDYVKDEEEIASSGNDGQTSSDSNTGDTQTPSASTDNKNVVTGKIEDIKTSVNDGNTVYYLKVGGKYYYIKVTDCMDVLLMQKGDQVEITTDGGSGNFIAAKTVKAK